MWGKILGTIGKGVTKVGKRVGEDLGVTPILFGKNAPGIWNGGLVGALGKYLLRKKSTQPGGGAEGTNGGGGDGGGDGTTPQPKEKSEEQAVVKVNVPEQDDSAPSYVSGQMPIMNDIVTLNPNIMNRNTMLGDVRPVGVYGGMSPQDAEDYYARKLKERMQTRAL